MKTVSVEEAEGMILCHDMTQIIPGKFKGVAFRKGHIIQKEDIEKLRDMGKKNIFVWDKKKGMLHENEAAIRIASASAGSGVLASDPKEGKVNLAASHNGLLKINMEGLKRLNCFQGVVFASLHTNMSVRAGRKVAGTRIIPLVIEEETIRQLEYECGIYFPLIQVKPFKSMKAGIVTTGSEVYEGRIKDAFGPVLKRKLEESGSSLLEQAFVPDSAETIANTVQNMVKKGAELVLITGGMSVDPDDVTPEGIRRAGGKVVSYGAPVLPGAMFMLAYIGNIPVMGLPGCVMYSRTSVFDLVYPRIQAGEFIQCEDIVKLAHGGMCQECDECRYPDCAFGKCSG